jgi:shikimate dehydrogenase
MARYAVIGHPVEHSQSPWIHGTFAEQTGQLLQYEKLLAPLDGFASCLEEFARSTEPRAHGCNITVPFKAQAFGMAPHRSARALLAGAANTLRFDAEGWLADNTDGAGLVTDIQVNAGTLLKGLRVLLIGAGGAAAGAIGPLLEARPAELIVSNRTPGNAQALVARHQSVVSRGTVLKATALSDCGESFDVIINASASSLQGDPLPVTRKVFKPGSLALDMMYGPAAQAFMEAATQEGAIPRDGLGMLVEQAAEAFHLWRGVRPHTKQVLAQLRQKMRDHSVG